MPTNREVIDYVFNIAPDPKLLEPTENGLLFGSGDAEVNRIAVLWRPTPKLLDEARRFKANLVVGHESIFYRGLQEHPWGIPLREADKPINKKHRALLEAYDMAYVRFHSNIDIASWGMPVELLRVLGFGECLVEWFKYIPLVHVPAVSVKELADHCMDRLGLTHTRVVGNLDAFVSRVSVCWGGISNKEAGIDCALHMKADGIIAGDLTDAAALSADAADVPVVECGHAHTEMPAMRLLAKKIAERFPSVEVYFLPNDEPWVVVSSIR